MATNIIVGHEGGDIQFIVGTYDLKLIKSQGAWKLCSMRFNFKFTAGNPDLASEAQRRAASKSKEKSNA